MSSLFDWSTTAGSNTSVGGVNIAEGMSPALVDDAMRQIMAIVRASFDPSIQNFLNNSAALPIASGGTGAITAAAALTALGGLGIAYQRLPVIAKSAAFNPVDADAGSAYNYTGAAAAMTLNPNGTTAITAGGTFVVRNNGSGALTITRGSGVSLLKNGSTTSADATLAIGGVATLINWAANDWTITGSGIS